MVVLFLGYALGASTRRVTNSKINFAQYWASGEIKTAILMWKSDKT